MSATYLGYVLAQWLSQRLPAPTAFAIADRLADVQWARSRIDRRAVQVNVAAVLGAPVSECSPLVRETFRNFGRYLVEFFTVHQGERPEVRVEGRDYFAKAQHRQRGVILLTAHLGNWELAAVVLRRMGFPVAAVALPHRDPRMDRLFNQQRHRCGVTVIPAGTAALQESLRCLKEGRLLGLLGDREFFGHGVAVSLWGRSVMLPRGPAIVSLRSRTPVVPTFLIREGRWRFRFCFEPPIWPESGSATEVAVQALTQRYGAVFERYIRQVPDQWLMFRPVVG